MNPMGKCSSPPPTTLHIIQVQGFGCLTTIYTHTPVACLHGLHVCQRAVEILLLTLNTRTHAR